MQVLLPAQRHGARQLGLQVRVGRSHFRYRENPSRVSQRIAQHAPRFRPAQSRSAPPPRSQRARLGSTSVPAPAPAEVRVQHRSVAGRADAVSAASPSLIDPTASFSRKGPFHSPSPGYTGFLGRTAESARDVPLS